MEARPKPAMRAKGNYLLWVYFENSERAKKEREDTHSPFIDHPIAAMKDGFLLAAMKTTTRRSLKKKGDQAAHHESLGYGGYILRSIIH